MGVVIDSPGHVVFRDLPAPPAQLEKGYYLVEMAAAPINPSDLMYIEGRYPASAPTAPGKLRVGGFEGTGIVRAAGGGDAKHSMVNHPVALWIPEGGTWAHQVVVPAHLVMELPKGVSLGLGSPWVNPLTALALVQKAQNHHDPMTGKSLKPVAVALTAAASSLGRMIIRLAAEKKSNLVVLGIVRKAEQCDQLRSLGCEHCFTTTDPAFDDQFREAAAHLNCTLCYDCVGGSLPGRILRLMPPGSTVVVYGSLDPQPTLDGLSPMDLLIHGKRIEGFHLHMFLEAIGKKDTAKLMTTARDKWAGPLATSINKRLPMDQVSNALEEYRRNMSAGKVLLTGPAMPPEELRQPPSAEAPAAQSTAPTQAHTSQPGSSS
ncbi:putative oxidoreductase zinc-binding dehydrogenase [Paratrimastix pyriformis]|uniref:Oxidoreductase zinc-binding dehydrogenase n=1 Tax=Paratrimastix pyriformis TaxID=342808 RepID=A0ABQ8UVL3_9EUKA|nr:putative oxidoreductase zinc-binding dehydrogenase [Paratrimastix pyriformis]